MTGTGTVGFPRSTAREKELARQELLLAELTELLAARETDLATSQAELGRFRIDYLRRFAPLYAELDRIESEIARLLAHADPDDPVASGRARRAARQAWRSEEAARAADASTRHRSGARTDADDDDERRRPIDPSLRELYRRAAKALHPDMATTDEERARRTRLMAAVNEAYTRDDADAILAILDGEAIRPGAAATANGDVAERLARVQRMIASVKRRLAELETLQAALEGDLMWLLYTECRAAWLAGDDPLARDEAELRAKIDTARDRLSTIQIATPMTSTEDRP